MLTYKNKLVFDEARLMHTDEKTSYDITVIVMFMPNNADEPMKLIDYYFGEPDEKTAQKYVDKFGDSLTDEEIKVYAELQDMPHNL